MYKIVGVDGKEYGPVSLEQMQRWVAEGRVNPRTQVQEAGATEWKTAAEFPELSAALAAAGFGATPFAQPPSFPSQVVMQQKGLAVTSFVLGLVSLVCFGFLTGIPAIICGHIAHSRARRLPAQYGGTGFAIAGFALGYASFLATCVLVAMFVPALAKAKEKAQSISCMNNMRQIGLAFQVWSLTYSNHYPFNVTTNAGGTLELCLPENSGYDKNAALHLMVLSSQLATPRILICPADSSKQPALGFGNLQPLNVSYQVRSGPNISIAHPQEVLVVCPIHGHVLLCDGSVQTPQKKSRAAQPGRN
jgi:hypothetical protein